MELTELMHRTDRMNVEYGTGAESGSESVPGTLLALSAGSITQWHAAVIAEQAALADLEESAPARLGAVEPTGISVVVVRTRDQARADAAYELLMLGTKAAGTGTVDGYPARPHRAHHRLQGHVGRFNPLTRGPDRVRADHRRDGPRVGVRARIGVAGSPGDSGLIRHPTLGEVSAHSMESPASWPSRHSGNVSWPAMPRFSATDSETAHDSVPALVPLGVDQIAALAGCGAVFLPGDPPRSGRVAFHPAAAVPLGTGEIVDVPVVLKKGDVLRRGSVRAVVLPVARAVPVLAQARKNAAAARPETAFWGTAVLYALQLVAKGRLLPGVSPDGFDAWRVGPLDQADALRLRELADAMPPEARATPMTQSGAILVPEAEALLRAFLDAIADVLPRTPAAVKNAGSPVFAAAEPQRIPHQRGWAAEVATGIDVGVRVSLRVETPGAGFRDDLDDAGFAPRKPRKARKPRETQGDDAAAFRAVVQLHSLADPTIVTDAGAAWHGLAIDGESGARTQIDTLLTLRRAARVWKPLGRLLQAAVPDALDLADEEVNDLLGDASTRLAAAGVDVHLPKDLVRALTAQAVISAPKRPESDLPSYFGTHTVLNFRWEIALGGQKLTKAEMDRIAEATRPLVRLRDQWVLLNPELIRKAKRRELKPLTAIDALGVALTGTADVDGHLVPVAASGWIDELRKRINDPESAAGKADVTVPQPAALQATLREYQLRGLTWLDRMAGIGLGGCLADDMGLGKTITLIALHLHRQQTPATSRPTLVVCPTSLLGNWEREIQRFAPGTPVRRHHGPGRTLADLEDTGFVLTTYGTLRLDAKLLADQDWGILAADEAQHVKNPYSHTARALREIRPQARIALTGTPVENNLSELWAILDWTTPGLLGTLNAFRDRYAKAVEGGQDRAAAERLAKLVKPFVLRRRKSDPGIAPELPPKTETDHPVALTREQAALYEAFVRETLAKIAESVGIERRGLVLKLLTALKQICNHPAQFLKETEGKKLTGRSGKLELLDELLDTILAEDGSVLVFSQYVAMNRIIEKHLAHKGIPTQFLHGQTPVAKREEMVQRFQDGEVPVFLLSLKAAGTGLNLTRAGHVVHYDRWWNPAVEEQATDRAYRIGQTQPVQVHRLIAEGTIEDRIAETLKAKRALADSVLSAGEAAFTELTNAELAELVSLRRSH